MTVVKVTNSELSGLLTEIKANGITKIAVGAIVTKSGKVLMLERCPNDFLGGFIELPGGGVEVGETITEAIIRELFEETGLTAISVDSYVNFFDYSSEDGLLTRQLNFKVSVPDDLPVLNPAEHVAYIYVTPTLEELDKLNISAKTKASVLESIS